MFDPNDLVGALLYHRELIERSETPQERGLAVYLVISGVTGEDHFLAGLQPLLVPENLATSVPENLATR